MFKSLQASEHVATRSTTHFQWRKDFIPIGIKKANTHTCLVSYFIIVCVAQCVYLLLLNSYTSMCFTWFPILDKTASLKWIWALIGSPWTNQSFLTAKQPRAWLYLRGDPLFASGGADWPSARSHHPMRNGARWGPEMVQSGCGVITPEKGVGVVCVSVIHPIFLIINTSWNNGTPSALNPLKYGFNLGPHGPVSDKSSGHTDTNLAPDMQEHE